MTLLKKIDAHRRDPRRWRDSTSDKIPVACDATVDVITQDGLTLRKIPANWIDWTNIKRYRCSP